ncbi:chalcone isomerase family protein [Pandoraea sp.]|uniref:chalcone isomerase family protein n=1 Tax=Pandoraea sp. TaxID=1883445 RepID=UPI0035B49ED7
MATRPALCAWLRIACFLAALGAAPGALAFDAGQLASQEIPAARLVGHGSFSRLGFHLYDAELFSGAERVSANWSAHPLVLDLRYARSFSSGTLVQRSLMEMTKLKVATDAQRQHWGEALARILPDVSAGQHLTGVFRPGDGTRFFSDGKLIGQIAGDAFGRAFFAIWLDPRTSAPDLRAELISDAR